MSIELFAAEMRAELAPYDADETPAREWLSRFPGRDGFGRPPADDRRVALTPLPIFCPLPQERGRPLTVAGFASTGVSSWRGRAAITSVSLGVDSDAPQEVRSLPRRALEPSRAVARPGQAVTIRGGAGRDFGVPAELLATRWAFDDALDLCSLVDLVAEHRVAQGKSGEARGPRPASAFRVSGGGEIRRGRLVVLRDPSLDSGADADWHLQATYGELEGGTDPYLCLLAHLPSSRSEEHFEQDVSQLFTALEHAVAHRWLLRRGQWLNDQQLNLVQRTLLNREASAREVNEARYRLLERRTEFLERVDSCWTFGVELPPAAASAVEHIDSIARLRQLWDKEVRRFAAIEGLAQEAASLDRERASPPEPDIDWVKEHRSERNPFKQLRGWRARPRGQDTPVEIELHPLANRSALFEEISASIATSTFMTAASVLFLGLVLGSAGDLGIARAENPRPPQLLELEELRTGSMELDVLLLFIASFGFLFSTLIYANLSGRLARLGTSGHERQLELANSVSEYLGVYPLIFGLPLSVPRYLGVGVVSIIVAVLAVGSLFAYHHARGVSILERDVGDHAIGTDWIRKRVLIPGFALFSGGMYLGNLLRQPALELPSFVALMALTGLVFAFSLAAPARAERRKYRVDAWDALGREARSHVDPDWRPRRLVANEVTDHSHEGAE